MNIQQLFKQGMDREIPELLEANEFLPSVDLGASGVKRYANIALGLPDWDFPRDPIPFEQGSVGTVHAYHFLEHLTGEEAIKLLREVERVLAPGGVMNIAVPYYNSLMQAQDLTHKSVWCGTTIQTLFNNAYYDPAGEWQLKLHTQFIMGIVEHNMALFIQLVKPEA